MPPSAATVAGLLAPLSEAASPAPGAGGAPLDQLLIVSLATALMYAALAWVMLRERRGRTTLVGRAADLVARIDGGPRWFGLPAAICILSALSAGLGVYWDVSYHITEGRDEGPLANPSHYLIFLGLLGMFFGGALSMALARERLPRRTVRVTRTWHTPYGPAVITGTLLCALAGFPLDDLWHRLFGQDVTEWGPTHVLMIGGAVLLPYGLLLSAAEARQVGSSRLAGLVSYVAGAYLVIGPVAFLLEYAFGVPQFPLVMDPVIITVATVAGLVLASHQGARHVVAVWAAYVVIQGAFQLYNDVLIGALSPRFPLLAGGVVAAATLARFARPTASYGATAGALVGLATVAGERYWTNAVRPVEWPVELMPMALAYAAVVGAGMGLVVTWMHTRLAAVEAAAAASTPPAMPAPGRPALPRALVALGALPLGGAAVAGLLALLGTFAWNVPPRHDLAGASADVTVGEVRGGTAVLDVRIDPDLADRALWFHVLAWQGGDLARVGFTEVEPGRFRTEEPVPVSGPWKTMVRLHLPPHTLVAAPVHLPDDPAIPAPAFEATDGPRDFVDERLILQRERRTDVPAWLWSTAYLVVGAVYVALVAVLGAGFQLAGRPSHPGRATGGPTPVARVRRRQRTGVR